MVMRILLKKRTKNQPFYICSNASLYSIKVACLSLVPLYVSGTARFSRLGRRFYDEDTPWNPQLLIK